MKPSIALHLTALLLTLVTALPAQHAFHSVPYNLTSGLLTNLEVATSRAFEQVIHIPGARSLRIVFAAAELGGDDDRIVVSHPGDGNVHPLSRLGLKQWRNRSAFFNGDRVTVALDLAPGSYGTFAIRQVIAQFAVPSGDTLCGADDRAPSSDDRVCRLVDAVPSTSPPCTGFLINAQSTVLSAGHCDVTASFPSAFGVAEFEVPASSAAGTMTHADVDDQFPVDTSSVWSTNIAIGDDWAVMRLHPNAFGTTAAAKYGFFTLASSVPIGGSGYTVRVTGYGDDTTPMTRNNTQQTSTGPLTGSVGVLSHAVDTMSGNSGSPIIRESSGEVIGIHTNGGCTATGGANKGTRIDNVALAAALYANSGCGTASLADSTATITCTPTIFNVTPTAGLWNVVGLSSPYDWDMSIESTSSASSFDACDFLISNGHLGTSPPRSGTMTFGLFPGTTSHMPTAEHQTASGHPLGEGVCTTFLAGQVLDLYEFTVTTPGAYDVSVSGDPSLGWRLFAPGVDSSWRPRSSAVASGDVSSAGVTTVALGAGSHALVIYLDGGPSAAALPVNIFVGASGSLVLDATTSGAGAGDLCLNVAGLPAAATDVILLVSTTPGGGVGPVFGLAPSPLLIDILLLPSIPGHPLHFPVGANPYATGPLSFPAGTFAPFAGTIWETLAVAYDAATVTVHGITPIKPIPW